MLACGDDELINTQVDTPEEEVIEEQPVEPYCGDGNVDEGEECDPGTLGHTADCNSDCTIPLCLSEKLIYDTGRQTFEYDLSTGVERLLCERREGSDNLTDVGVSPDGILYGIRERLFIIDQDTCELTLVGDIQNLTSINSLTFLPDGTALTGANNTSDLYRLGVAPFSETFWGSIAPFEPAGDYIFIRGKIYIATADSHLLEVTVDENYAFLSYKDLGVMDGVEKAFGLSFANGQLWIGTDAGELFTVTQFAPVEVRLEAVVENRIWGLTSVSESLACSQL